MLSVAEWLDGLCSARSDGRSPSTTNSFGQRAEVYHTWTYATVLRSATESWQASLAEDS